MGEIDIRIRHHRNEWNTLEMTDDKELRVVQACTVDSRCFILRSCE